jgi:hypothetical protein
LLVPMMPQQADYRIKQASVLVPAGMANGRW